MRFVFYSFLSVFLMVCFCGCSSEKDDVNIMLNLSVQQAKSEQWKNTLNLAQDALKIDKNNTDALLIKAVAAENLGDWATAVDSALLAVKINPDNFVALYTLGRLYSLDNSRLSDAISYLEKAHKINPDDADTLVLLSNCAIKLKSKKSVMYLNRLSNVNGAYATDADYCNMLGCANVFNNRFADAGKNFIFANKYSSSKDPIIAYNLAVFFDTYNGKRQNAVAFYKIFLNLVGNKAEFAEMKQNVQSRLKKIQR